MELQIIVDRGGSVINQPRVASLIGTQGLHRVDVYQPDPRLLERDPLVDDVLFLAEYMGALFKRAGQMIGAVNRN
jgi:hypothetical protein